MARPPRRAPPPAPRTAWLLAVPLALAAIAYARVLHGEFLLDDFPSILDNPAVKDLGATLRAFPAALLRSGRPVVDLTFALDYARGRLDPFGFHLVNVAIHLAVVGLVFLFTRAVVRMAGGAVPEAIAVVVAGLFALHPLQSQAVSYVVQRAESLASGLYLAALLLLVESERRGRTARGVAAYAGAVLAFVLGMGTKVTVATMPAAYLLLAALVPGPGREGRRGWGRRLAMVAPLAALDAWLSLATARSLSGQTHAGFGVQGLSPGGYFLTQLRVVATYLRLLALPVGQSGYWVVRPSRSLLEPAVLASGLLLLALLAAAAALLGWGRGRDDPGGAAARVAAFGTAWFFLLLAPTSSVVPLADLLFEHRVYLASWGVFAAATVGAERLWSRVAGAGRPLAAAAAVGALWGVLAFALHARNAVWETRLAFWSDAVAKAPLAQRPHLNLAYAYWDRGEPEQAIREYRLALEHGGRAAPADEAFILNNLGVALLAAGRGPEAVEALERAASLAPSDPSPLANLALAMARRDELAAAEAYATRALALDARHGGALVVLGGVRLARGDAAGAVEAFERAARADPDDPERWFDLGVAEERLGQLPEACGAWRQVLRIPGAGELGRKAASRSAAAGCGRGRPAPAGPAR